MHTCIFVCVHVDDDAPLKRFAWFIPTRLPFRLSVTLVLTSSSRQSRRVPLQVVLTCSTNHDFRFFLVENAAQIASNISTTVFFNPTTGSEGAKSLGFEELHSTLRQCLVDRLRYSGNNR
ncbi:unnamed protein product [Protopolystoma xenopodis]|uniref:Uncharacterized protein n=1 Tax=Protopolystoma xenopodis TaxID=117903 RepID=A0A448XE74_9PLAT|nr:unnamed protein product [Protopolystoma xenopodis]